MKTHNLISLVKLDQFPYDDPSELDSHELSELREQGINEAWYYYLLAPYEGSGLLIARKGNLFCEYDLGHCSCYGPEEALSEPFKGQPYDVFRKSYSDNPEWWNDIKFMFKEIEKTWKGESPS